jgi:hypothetical protein
MRLDLDDGYLVRGEDINVILAQTRVSDSGKTSEKVLGYHGSFEAALRAYVDVTARRDGGAAEILRYLAETKAAAAEIGRAMDAERKAAAHP